MKRILLIIFLSSIALNVCAQDQFDTIQTKRLDEVVVKAQRLNDLERLPETEGTRLWSGKKNEVINLQSLNANIAEKTGRQILQKCRSICV